MLGAVHPAFVVDGGGETGRCGHGEGVADSRLAFEGLNCCSFEAFFHCFSACLKAFQAGRRREAISSTCDFGAPEQSGAYGECL